MVIVSLIGIVASEVAFGFSTGIVFAFVTRFMTGIFNGKFKVLNENVNLLTILHFEWSYNIKY